MSLWRSHASSAKFRICRTEEPSEQREQHRPSPHRASTVSFHLITKEALILTDTSVTSTTTYERSSAAPRLKSREENSIRWTELIDKFKSVQEKSRRSQLSSQRRLDQEGASGMQNTSLTAALSAAATSNHGREKEKAFPDAPRGNSGLGIGGVGSSRGGYLDPSNVKAGPILGGTNRNKSSLSHLGRLGIGGRRTKR